MASEGRELRSPDRAIAPEPHVELRERFRIEPLEPSLRVDADDDEPGLLQRPEVPRHAGAGHVEVLGDASRGELVVLGEELDHPQPGGIGETLEHVHGLTVTTTLRNVNVAQPTGHTV